MRKSHENVKAGGGDFFLQETLNGWVETANFLRDGEGILRHPISVWYCDLKTDLGDIMIW